MMKLCSLLLRARRRLSLLLLPDEAANGESEAAIFHVLQRSGFLKVGNSKSIFRGHATFLLF